MTRCFVIEIEDDRAAEFTTVAESEFYPVKVRQAKAGVQAITQARQAIADGLVPAADGDLVTQAMWHLATEGIQPRLERLALAGALVAMEIEKEIQRTPA